MNIIPNNDKLKSFQWPISTLNGVIVPTKTSSIFRRPKKFALACPDGDYYHFLGDNEWDEVLSSLLWQSVLVKGVIFPAQSKLKPRAIIPRGPSANGIPTQFVENFEDEDENNDFFRFNLNQLIAKGPVSYCA